MQALVDGHEVLLGLGNQQTPEPQRGLVTALQQYNPPTGTLGECLVAVELGAGRLIEPVQVTDRQFLGGLFLTDIGLYPQPGVEVAKLICEEIRETLVELIRSVHVDEGKTVLMVEHHMEVVTGLAQRIAVLHHGSLLAVDTPDAIMRNETVQQAYLGEPL